MLIKKENLCVVVDTYTDQQGQEKNVYKAIGEIVTLQGNNGQFQKVNLFHMPGANISVFEQNKDGQTQQATQADPANPTGVPIQPATPQMVQNASQEIRTEDIPF